MFRRIGIGNQSSTHDKYDRKAEEVGKWQPKPLELGACHSPLMIASGGSMTFMLSPPLGNPMMDAFSFSRKAYESNTLPNDSDPEKAARCLMEHAQAFEPIQDGRIYIEKINGPFLFGDKGTPAEYSAGLELAISRGWRELHESGTYVKFTQAGAELFA